MEKREKNDEAMAINLTQSYTDDCTNNQSEETAVTIWIYQVYGEALRQIVEQYRDSLPLVDIMEFEDLNVMYESLISAMAAGTLPDLVLLDNKQLVRLVELNPQGFDYLCNLYPEEDFLSAQLNELVQQNGRIYGCPYASGAVAFYYRKDITDKYGVVLEENPTWEQVIELCKQVQNETGEDFYLLPYPSGTDIEIMMKSHGFCFYDESGTMTTEGCPEVISFYDDLAQNRLLCPTSNYQELDEYLQEGKLLGLLAILQRFLELSNLKASQVYGT